MQAHKVIHIISTAAKSCCCDKNKREKEVSKCKMFQREHNETFSCEGNQSDIYVVIA